MRYIYILVCLVFLSSYSFSQISLDKLKDKANKKIEKNIDKAADKVLDKTEEKVNGIGQGKTDTPEAVEEKSVDETPTNTETTATEVKPDETPKLVSYTKYDFVPGDQILFYEDFSQDAIGDFPALWTTNGSGEIRTFNSIPGNWLFFSSEGSSYCLMKDLTLPDNFIVEFDIVGHNPADLDALTFYFDLFNSSEDWLETSGWPGNSGYIFHAGYYNLYIQGYAADKQIVRSENKGNFLNNDKVSHFIIWIQKRRARVYFEGQKVLDGPTALAENVKYNRMRFNMWDCQGNQFVSNIKITTAAPDTRTKLLTEGKLISYGISFDSGKDVVRAESYGALNDIAKVLKENPAVRIKVVGHTDADGDNAQNLDLSKRRAANVKNSLVKDFGIDAGRIDTDGKGETEPIAGNDNSENKAKNRRVEFLKL